MGIRIASSQDFAAIDLLLSLKNLDCAFVIIILYKRVLSNDGDGKRKCSPGPA